MLKKGLLLLFCLLLVLLEVLI